MYDLLNSMSKLQHSIALRIGDDIIHVEPRSCLDSNKLSVECMKVEVARICYLQLSDEKQSNGTYLSMFLDGFRI